MAISNEEDFKWVIANQRTAALIDSTAATLEWDERTGLPSDAGEYRADQVTFLSGLSHDYKVSPEQGERLERLVSSPLASDPHTQQGATIRCLWKDFNRNRKLPKDLVQRTSHAIAVGQQKWAIARPANDFKSFLPHLQQIIELRREEATLLQLPMQTRYDALVDQYEEGATVAILTPILNTLRDALIPLIQRCQNSKQRPDGKSLQRPFDVTKQKHLAHWIAEKVGYQFNRGRLDETDHPFCTSLGPHDHRILTRYDANHFSSGFYGALHEAGHAMYEQGLPTDWFGLPPGTAVSLGIHESQSRLWENVVGRSKDFWVWCLPEIQKIFPESLGDVDHSTFYRDLNLVEPSLIRVDSDEVTYNLHILIRFELEREIFDGSLAAEDLPEAWNDRYRAYLGIDPPDDRDGILQDVHWSAGLFGYFATYMLGNIYASQLMNAASKAIGDLDKRLRVGDFAPLLEWLRWNIHAYGRRLSPRELIRQATGEDFSSQPMIEYLRAKVDDVYGK